MSGIIKIVHRSDDPDGPFKTIKEVAEYFERSKDTIRRWGEVIGVPTHKMMLGDGNDPNAFVWCYTEDDIAALEDYSSGINPKGGRPRKEEQENV
jgi:hypothetical protein